MSFSQQGEDLIIDYLFNWLSVSSPTYLDVGAHHPTYLSNTYFFYRKGMYGVCIEPDPELNKKIQSIRKHDTCLNVGIGLSEDKNAEFYIMDPPTLNTFSKEEAEMYTRHYPYSKIVKTISVPLMPINDVIEQYCKQTPSLVSIDTEGLDLAILQSFNFNINRPEVFCIETISYSGPKSLKKNTDILKLMEKNKYFLYADTLINSIFVDKEAWKKHSMPKLDL